MRTLLSVISIFCSILSVYVASGILVYTATGIYETENSVTAAVKPSSATISNLPKQNFILKTHVHSGQNLTKNGLYVDTYHTGAGEFAVVLVNHKSQAKKAFFNGTNVLFDLGTPFPWGLVLRFAEPYTSWGEVGISVGGWGSDLVLVGNKLVWSNDSFKGWIVCDWSLQEPQLFWKNYLFREPVPSNCASVDLVTVNVKR